MLTKEQFVQIISHIQKYENFVTKVGNYVMLEKFDELFYPGIIQDIFLHAIYDIPTVDKINYWLYESNGLDASIGEIEDFYDSLNDNG